MIVAGNYRNRAFADVVNFTMIPPKGRDYQGNGYHMNVFVEGNPSATHYIDVRYAQTRDVEKLARIWIKDFYGNTATDIRKLDEGGN